MNRILFTAAAVLLTGAAAVAAKTDGKQPGAARQSYEIFVDDQGVMRRSDNGAEVSYYGTNYTAPFAYSYRALGYEGKNVEKAIDRDVYHIARLGLNAFRLHLWDAELADSAGNLVENEHLRLLDYLIAQLEKRGIDIVLTAQTNFGNGYPEKDIDTGAFTYDFPKCEIHDNPAAQAAQERYLAGLVQHRNPYTGRTYGQDKAIIALEINNEPCHSGTQEEVTAYIDRMCSALRKAGYKRPILYNVTHNPAVTPAYYNASDIQGTTYQWYPTSLVAKHERKGNFLPALDNYNIPWDTIPQFNHLAKVVYEFDPGDVLYSHLYPAIARTFRKQGFQWITQFAYDPIDLAQYNTEYVTHYLNLAYTPAKALSMMIAAEAARETPRGADYGRYPQNSTFGHTTVSHDPDLSIFNSPQKYIYTNSTSVAPVCPDSLQLVAGHGSSPVVSYGGTGAYFLDATAQPGVWRLEVMPDVTQLDDPFAATSLNDAKFVTTPRSHPIRITLPSLGSAYTITPLNPSGSSSQPFPDSRGAIYRGRTRMAANEAVDISPGVYLLARQGITPDMALLQDTKVAGNIGLAEYVAPEPARLPIGLLSALPSDTDLDVNRIPDPSRPDDAWRFTFDHRNPSWHDPEYYLLEFTPSPDRRDAINSGRTSMASSDIIAIRRRVGDKIDRLPENIQPTAIGIRFMPLDPTRDYALTQTPPPGTEIAVVTRDGYTYSAPLPAPGRGAIYRDDTSPAAEAVPGRGAINRGRTSMAAEAASNSAPSPATEPTTAFSNKESTYMVPLTQLRPREGVIMPAPYPTMLDRRIPAPLTPFPTFRDIEFIQLLIPASATTPAAAPSGGATQAPVRLLLQEIWLE